MSLRWPVSNVNVTQKFGADFLSNGKWYYKQIIGQQGHNGIDIGVPTGTPIYAADDGFIKFEGWGQNHSWMGSSAGICILQHVGGAYVSYDHLMSTVVSNNQQVKKGQLIAYSDSTGASTGPHLHFEMLPLAPNFKNGYAGRIDITPYIESNQPPQEEEPMIQNAPNWRGRVAREFMAHWGRGPTEEEFMQQVGSTMLTLAERLGDNPETDNQIHRALVGRTAISDDWQGQIYSLAQSNAELNQKIADQAAQMEELKKTGNVDQETKDNVNWLVKAFKSIFRIGE